jgi:hypothetical protein
VFKVDSYSSSLCRVITTKIYKLQKILFKKYVFCQKISMIPSRLEAVFGEHNINKVDGSEIKKGVSKIIKVTYLFSI